MQNRAHKIARAVAIVGVSVALGSSCKPAPVDDPPSDVKPTGTPLPQVSNIPIQAWTGTDWMTVHPSQLGMERLAQTWCTYQRTFIEDDKACGTTVAQAVLQPPGIANLPPSGGDFAVCNLALCVQRNEVCAGYMLEELGRSPLQRVLDAATFDAVVGTSALAKLNFHTGEDGLQLPKAELDALSAANRGGGYPRRLRFQPLAAEGRAAAFRGSLNRFRDAGRWAHEIRSFPVNGLSCFLRFQANDYLGKNGQASLLPTLDPNPDGSAVAWTDLFVTTFMDGVNEFSGVLPRTIDSMKDAAAQVLNGVAAPQDAVATQWNGKVNSATAAAKVLAYGDGEPPPGPPQAMATGCQTDMYPAAEIGPTGVPVCPPVSQNAGVQASKTLLAALKLKPSGDVTVVSKAVDAYFKAKADAGLPVGANPEPAQMYQKEGFTENDLITADLYKCQEAKAFGIHVLPLPGGGAVQKYSGTQGAAGPLPSGVFVAHFMGAPKAEANLDLTSPGYSAAGAVPALDQMQATGAAIKQDLTAVVDPQVSNALDGVLKMLDKQLGGRRLEFLIGKATLDNASVVDRVQVLIHGVPATGETFWAVQGLAGLKCVLGGNIDGAECNPADYKHSITTTVGTLDPRMSDLQGGTISEVLTSLPRPGNATAPISIIEAIYIVRITNAQFTRAFGGVVPSPVAGGFLPTQPPYVPNGALYSRRVLMPAGGTYEEVLGKVLAPNTNDCSQPQTECAGLSKNLWPPLENEISADPAAHEFERNWEIYLNLARQAAEEADALGQKVMESGLNIDERSEEAQQALVDQCGADANGATGCTDSGSYGGDTVEWSALGDKQACMWEVDGIICGCGASTCPDVVKENCPLTLGKNLELPPGDATLAKTVCDAEIKKRIPSDKLPNNYKVIPVFERIGIAQVEDVPAANCTVFQNLRTGNHAKNDRLNLIRQLAQEWGQNDITAIASELKYEEGFADNYRLTYRGNVVFDTERNGRPSSNSEARPPCNYPPGSKTSGSDFWNQEVACFESGLNCLNPDQGIGKDGCKNLYAGADSLSLDTEPKALVARWAWGFGHLRRSMAVLGVITGNLSGTMALSEWIPGITNRDLDLTDGFEEAGWNNRIANDCVPPDNSALAPNWARRCGNDAARCVNLGGDPGVGGDLDRYVAGRPVNANGWLTNRRAVWGIGPAFGPDETSGAFLSPAEKFPCNIKAPGQPCIANGGVDPQMVYCGLPPASALFNATSYANWGAGGLNLGKLPLYTSAFVGQSRVKSIAFKSSGGGAWASARDLMWNAQFPDDLCSKGPGVDGRYAIWHAFCSTVAPLPLPDALHGNTEFMRKAIVPTPGKEYFARHQVGAWLAAHASKTPEFMLFDLSSTAYPPAFQYAVTQRNIYDALELACHAKAQPVGQGSCDAIDPNFDYRNNLPAAAAIVRCMERKVRGVASRLVVGPVPKSLLTAYSSGKPLASTGHGGKFLEAMNDEYAALVEIKKSFDHIAASYNQIALVIEKVDAIERKTKKQVSQLTNTQIATLLTSVAQAARDFAQAGDLVKAFSTFGTGNSASAWAGALTLAGAHFEMKAISDAISVAKIEGMIETINAAQEALTHITNAQDAAANIPVQVNAFILAADRLRGIQKKADILKAQVDLLSFAGPDGKDPQYVNTVMRRVYNTNLVRYERALDRARKLSFIARRAIELRFGVDLERMTEDMTLVPAPYTWANRVCEMTGIKYEDIRQPDPEKGNEAFAFGEAPPESEEFSTQYIGDYVRRLEDFVASYSIDYPLKESDDVAVISLADDIARVRGKCVIPSGNRLYYSTEFDTRDTDDVNAESRGWFTGGCNLTVPVPQTNESVEWRGCVAAEPAYQDQGIAPPPISGGALPYRVGSRPCSKTVGVDGTLTACPNTTGYVAAGSLRQRLDGLVPGYYVVSLYSHPDAAAASYSTMNTDAEMRIVRDSDGALVESTSIKPNATGWKRHEVSFEAKAGETYSLEILPSTVPVSLDTSPGAGPESWPGLVVSAAQVEEVAANQSGVLPPASLWERTDLTRTIVDYACTQQAGYELRKLFKRRCQYICADGIKTQCAKIDDSSLPSVCFYEAQFQVSLEEIERGALIPTGQIAIGNFNYRHKRAGVNVTGTGVTNCENSPGVSCYANGFLEYTLTHSGTTGVRNWDGATLPVTLDQAVVEHGKALAAEKTVTNPPSSSDVSLIEPYMKGEYEGRPLAGLYTLRIWDRPELQWERIEDIQLIWRYHYWTRFQSQK